MLSVFSVFEEKGILFPISFKVTFFSEIQDICVKQLAAHCVIVVIVAVAFKCD